MKPLPKNYDHTETEKKWQSRWDSSSLFHWDESQPRENTFVIDTPPPTVSGLLHMGHIFSYTQADFIARYQRMRGKTVFYPMGFDDNGLPTERLVEKTKKIRATDMPREKFIEECESVAEEARGEFRALFKSVALSVDWRQEYHTISDDCRRISQLSFLDLFQKGHAYRELKPFFWDPVDQTAIAQAEIEDKEVASHANYIAFTLIPLSLRERAGVRAKQEVEKIYSPKELVEKSRTLRKEGTKAETLLWSHLRDRQLGRYKFRRQHPIDPYIADFACVEAKLIVELDGGQHNEQESIIKDQKRTAFLEKQGYRVLRFWNNEMMENEEGVLQTILDTLTSILPHSGSPHPDPLPEGEGAVTIMTTRPELLGACVALMCHPDDAHKYEGKMAVTPLFNVTVPIIADDKVDKEKGTGLVMCCTFGDETDVYWWKKHNLPTRIILNKYGKLDFPSPLEGEGQGEGSSQNTPHGESIFAQLQGKKTTNTDPKNLGAREITLQLLKDNGLLLKQEPITHAVKCAERSGAALELLPTRQWFIRLLDKKDELKTKAAQCNWYPQYMKVRIDQWTDGLNSDWCISRQRYFGVPFPVWYLGKENGDVEVIVASPEQLPVNPLKDAPLGYTLHDKRDGYLWVTKDSDSSSHMLLPDKDVMDTWATSSVSPQLSSHGINRNYTHSSPHPNPLPKGEGISTFSYREKGGGSQDEGNKNNPYILDSERHSKLFPADLRPQAHEIIRTWAFYTIVKAHLHEDSVPWHNLMISGWCLASDKTKMSKSKGNAVTPIALIEDKGSDAVRYWASTSRLGADTAFSEDLLKIGKKLVTKLWNATQFAAIHLSKLSGTPLSAAEEVKKGIISETLDIWVLSRLHQTIKKATEEFEKFEYCNARVAIEEFFWKDFCDNYLELVKARAYGEEAVDSSQSAVSSDNPTSANRQLSTVNSAAQRSAVHTIHHCLNALLKLFAPFMPHITEELFSHIFDGEYAATGSVHARGIWPDYRNFPYDNLAEERGIATVSVLEAIRKAKSERGVSIKYPVALLTLSAGDGAKTGNWKLIEHTLSDLKNAGNVTDIVWSDSADTTGITSDDGLFRIQAEFAEQV